MTSVPDDAVALDVPCPHCGERPIQQGAKNVRLAGFLLAYQIKRDTQIGCASCTRKKSWKSALITGLTGWWSIACLILNPFAILWNVGRGFVNRGPTRGLVETLEETGTTVEFLDDPDEFDPEAHLADEALLRGLAKLGCAVMLADGDADEDEAAVIREELAPLSPDAEEADVEELIEETARSDPTVEEVSEALDHLLTEDGRDVAVGLAARVAAADGEIDDEEVELIDAVADELGMEMDAEAIEAIVEMNAIMQEDEADDAGAPLDGAV